MIFRIGSAGIPFLVRKSAVPRITSYNVCYTKLLRTYWMEGVSGTRLAPGSAALRAVLCLPIADPVVFLQTPDGEVFLVQA